MSAPTRVRLCLLFVAILALNPGAPGIPVAIVSIEVPSPGHAPIGSPFHNVTTPLADGQLDPTFGSGGKTTSAFPGGYDIARATTLQPDGKIVVAGSADVRFAVGRYLPSGTLDPTFGVGGLAKTDFGELTDQANAIALQGDGKIVAAGFTTSDAFTRTVQFALARYNPDGSLDGTFGSGGKVVTTFPNTIDSRVFALAIQHDGKILAAGSSGDSFVHFALARYNSNGSLDSTFGTAGLVVTTIDVADQINSVAIQADEKIVAAGWSAPVAGDESENDFALTRYNPDGSLDNSFGSGGKVSTDFGGGGDVASALLLQPDGRIVAGGSTRIPGTGSMDFAVARYNTDGSLDSSFGSGGEVITDFGEPNPTFDVATSLLLHSDGGLLAVGYSRQNGLTGSLDLAIARYRTNGTLEPSFASGGKVITDLEGTDDQAYAAALQSNGKIIVVGVTERMGGFDWAVLRYLPGGTLDASFGSNGVCTTDGGAGSDMAQGVIVQRDGTLVAAGGSAGIGGGDFALAHYYADGTLDPSFGSGGKVTTDFLGGLDGANAAILQPDDKVLIVGTYAAPEEAQVEHGGFAVARYNTDGSLDNTFGSGGKVTTDLAGGYSGGGTANAVVLQADGKIVVAGTRWVGDCTRSCVASFALARYDSDGTLDSSFGTGGIVFTSFLNSYSDFANAVVLQQDGKIVVAGDAQIFSGSTAGDFALARYNTDGSLDNTFGSGGKVTTDFNTDRDGAQAVAVQTDGKIVAAGSAGIVRCVLGYCMSGSEFGLARYDPDGSLDPYFGTGGKTTTALAESDSAYALALQQDGKFVAAGSFGMFGAHQKGFALARYTPAGTLDLSFGVGSNGIVTTTFGVKGAAFSAALQPDSKIVAAGVGTTEAGARDFAVARYTNAPPPRCPSEHFTDVCPTDYFYQHVLDLNDLGVVSGYETAPPCDGPDHIPCFKPYNWSMRGQIAKIVSLAAGFNDPVTTQTFEDVPPAHTFYQYIERMASRNIITGYPCGGPTEPCGPIGLPYFRPGNSVTRGQIAKMVALAFGFLGPATTQTFEDVPPAHTFYDQIEHLAVRGIIGGYPCGNPEPCVPPNNRTYFRPGNNITRGQTAKIVNLARTQLTPTPSITLIPAPSSTPTSTATELQ